jgi:hypothetical protein
MPTDPTQGSLGAALAAMLDRCLEAGMSYPMTLTIVGRNGSVVAARYPAPGEPPASLAEHLVGPGMGLPINGLVTDENGGAAYVRMTLEAMSTQLLVLPEHPPLRSR